MSVTLLRTLFRISMGRSFLNVACPGLTISAWTHSFSLSLLYSHGHFRQAWIVNSTYPVVLKLMAIHHGDNLNMQGQVIREAIIMERLTSSPRIMDMYSHCGTSNVVQNMISSIDDDVVPPGIWEPNNEPRSTLSPSEKLEMALEMAKSLADLHGFEDGVIVHGDVQLGQWMRPSPHSKLVLGDFNLAKILPWDSHKEEYCKFVNLKNGEVSQV